ncbi:Cyclic di-GMP phosphodiesterase response regulator RpfG [Meiothermus luteus]|uniref:Cyclic di-GMP phosphodiesterase response regulator RpfG n=1 Tax=Meiothermus luteus TaxID=2026184 RepID=A0A399EJI1_9DEIN|nr:HD domain-containing phosphohydrolase [Meiothermus luteus]RIH83239.1 Cyclic di-GMP phosphodiesterase response regulator RpfG [Meiothermus luteus]RMH53283.1 MAG: HD domain-containing protein [Deinococcota bacterium]
MEAGFAILCTLLLLAAHWGRERWSLVPWVMLVSALSLLALSARGPSLGLTLCLQSGLLALAALDNERRWRSTLLGLLLIHLLALGPHLLWPSFLPKGAVYTGLHGLALLLAGWAARGAYTRLAPRNRLLALAGGLGAAVFLDAALLAGWTALPSLLLQALASGALLWGYLERVPPLPANHPLQRAYATLLQTMEALVERPGEELWPRILESAVRVVPGAQAGSIRLRQGKYFVFVAQTGFGEGILGVQSHEEEAMAWHGDPEAWRRGQPRIANHTDIQRVLSSHLPNQALTHRLDSASQQGRIRQIRSNLCMPILLGGEVVAEINLDAFRDRAFNEQSVEVARQYALQITVLLAGRRQQAELEARIREFEVIEALSAALRGLSGIREITKRLVHETIRLMKSEHAALLLIEPDGEHMRCYAAAGFFLEGRDWRIPKGRGFSWAAVEARAPIWSHSAHQDPRAFGRFKQPRPPCSEIAVPLISSKGEPLGALLSARNGVASYTERDLRLMQVIGNIAANTLERVQASESLKAEVAEKTALLELSQMLGKNDASLPRALGEIRRLAHADAAGLWVREGEVFRMRALEGRLAPEVQERLGEPVPRDHPLVQRVFSGEVVQVGDTLNHPHFQAHAQVGLRGLYLRRVVQEPELEAGLALFRLEPSPGWSPSEERLLQGATQMLGALLLRLERTRQLEAAYEGALRAIGLALEARDRETAGHTDRVAAMAEALGRALGLSEGELRDLRWGAYLHDVGKLVIPDSILLKPGKLTPEEFSTMKTHVQLGDDLVRHLPFVPKGARQVVRHHHERWDGRGYPDGLSGEQIPLLARIFAVCDVFDALCSERPYKPALPTLQAVQELWRSAQNGHLDRQLVEIFLKLQGLEEVLRASQAAD